MSTTLKPDLAVAAAGAVNEAEAAIKAQLQVLEQLAQAAGADAAQNRDFVRFRQLLRAALRVLDDETLQ